MGFKYSGGFFKEKRRNPCTIVCRVRNMDFLFEVRIISTKKEFSRVKDSGALE